MSTTKTPGQTARQAYFHTDTMSHWENLPATHKGDWERVAQVVLSAHAPKITAEELQKAHDELNIKATTVGKIGDQIVLGPVSAARLADAINSILQSRQSSAQEQEQWEKADGRIANLEDWIRAECEKLGNLSNSWNKCEPRSGLQFDDGVIYRRPRQPQRAGKERPEWMPSTPRDWTEDYPHENGNYECHCVKCGEKFYGHKRRVICKPCAAASGDSSTISPSDDPTLIGGWPIKQWELIKEFLVSYSMYSEAAMIRWVIREGQKSPKGGEGGTFPDLASAEAVGESAWERINDRVRNKIEGEYGPYTNRDWHDVSTLYGSFKIMLTHAKSERDTARAELATLHEENCILKSQVENADVNLAQVRAAVVQRYDAELAASNRDKELLIETANDNESKLHANREKLMDELATVKGELEHRTKSWSGAYTAAERIGWNGIENSKLLEQFILDTGEERDTLKSQLEASQKEVAVLSKRIADIKNVLES